MQHIPRVMVVTAVVACLLAPAHAYNGEPQANPNPAVKSPNRVLKLEELSFTDVDKLDRSKSVFFLTFGNLEEHGPQLPVGSDYFQAIGVRDRLIARLHSAHPDTTFVVVPVVPLGECGGNDFAGQFDHVGTFAVRFETLRNVAIDLGATIARKGFNNIFLIHSHGCPLHNVAFNDAAAFTSERYNVRMVNITSLVFGEGFYSDEVLDKYLGKGWQDKIGFEIHAGAAETSANLYLRGDLVKPEYKRLHPFVAKDMAEFLKTSERTGWNGYWGDPSRASKALGKELIDDFVERSYRIAEKALAGEDLSRLPVYPANLPPLPDGERLVKRELEIYDRQASEIDAWLKKRQPAAP